MSSAISEAYVRVSLYLSLSLFLSYWSVASSWLLLLLLLLLVGVRDVAFITEAVTSSVCVDIERELFTQSGVGASIGSGGSVGRRRRRCRRSSNRQ